GRGAEFGSNVRNPRGGSGRPGIGWAQRERVSWSPWMRTRGGADRSGSGGAETTAPSSTAGPSIRSRTGAPVDAGRGGAGPRGARLLAPGQFELEDLRVRLADREVVDLDEPLVGAQDPRHVLDRLVVLAGHRLVHRAVGQQCLAALVEPALAVEH